MINLLQTKLPLGIISSTGLNFQLEPDEKVLVKTCSIGSALTEELAQKLYNELLSHVTTENRILRFWNVIPFINEEEEGLERYKRFCIGRSRAFALHGFEDNLYPAASAVGSYQDEIFVAMIDSKNPVKQLSNSLQIEAYHYPQKYGPVGPSFSRASISSNRLFISGTASIRGHQSLHIDNLYLQTITTLENIEYLIQEANTLEASSFSPQNGCWRIYLRHPQEQTRVEKWLYERWGTSLQLEFCHADICRQELLIEIEGVLQCKNTI